MVDKREEAPEGQGTDAGVRQGKRRSTVEWNDERMQTSFADVVNIQGTKEQVELFFGTNRSWNVSSNGPVQVDLTNRMILTPHAAKRMSKILVGVLREYEARHGILKVDEE
ncbi:hypothetical protein LP7551_05064 [Roseibium album]|nr:hypothetical protein LP7551_05064 [Roseibium album]